MFQSWTSENPEKLKCSRQSAKVKGKDYRKKIIGGSCETDIATEFPQSSNCCTVNVLCGQWTDIFQASQISSVYTVYANISADDCKCK